MSLEEAKSPLDSCMLSCTIWKGIPYYTRVNYVDNTKM